MLLRRLQEPEAWEPKITDAAYTALQMAIDALNDIPSAEPEIIRCKDCKHWDKKWTNDWSPDYHYCPMIDGVRNGDWYCADAERRTDGEC